MKLNKILSFFLIASTLMATQAQAAVALAGVGTYLAKTSAVSTMSVSIPRAYTGLGFLVAGTASFVAGAVTVFFNPYVGVGLMVLSEDGSLSQSDLEQVLSQKYSFIQDPTVIADLASMIKEKAEMVAPVDGKIMVSISRAEVLSLIEGTDLLETHSAEINSLIKELK